MKNKLSHYPIAMTDLETSGDVFGKHEILEIGLVLFDQNTFEVLHYFSEKIIPEHIENAVPAALERNGYKKENWTHAVSLTQALESYAEITKGAIFCAFNATFDWGFMNEAFRKTGVKDQMDYHRLDLLSIAWDKGMKDQDSWSLKSTCEFFGIRPEGNVHDALSGAMVANELFKKLQKKL